LKQSINRQCCERSAHGKIEGDKQEECEIPANQRDLYEQCARRIGLNPECKSRDQNDKVNEF